MASVTFSSLIAEIFRDRLTAGQDGDVLQHGLAASACVAVDGDVAVCDVDARQ
jgi:hypothetical protein